MRPATISNSASGRSQGRATSCRRCGRDDTTNRNQCNFRSAPAVSSPRPSAREKSFRAAVRHRAALAYPPREDAEEYRVSFATPDARAQETNSANPQRILFRSETLTTGNDRALPVRKDQQSNLQSRRSRVLCPRDCGAEKHRTEDSPTENANPVKLR